MTWNRTRPIRSGARFDLVPNGTYDPNAPGVPLLKPLSLPPPRADLAKPTSSGVACSPPATGSILVIEVRLDDGVTVVLRSEALTITAK